MSGGATGWMLVLHGGAKEIERGKEEVHRAGCLAALAPGVAVLRAGGSALDAVEATIRALEDDPTFNAGNGSVRTADGAVEMDAALMDGATLDIGAVAGIRGVRHPIAVARMLLREAPILLVGEGADRFARECGAEMASNGEAARDSGHDTVGCVALDAAGHLAAGTSTGGLEGTMPGRVGDSPLPGCGFYADDALGAVAFSGTGEEIARATLAAHVMRVLETGPAREAAEAAIVRLRRVGGEAGGVVVSRDGRVGWAHNSPHFAVAVAHAGDEGGQAFLHRGEDTADG